MKLFISYSSHDRDAVKSLAQDLTTAVKTLPTNSEFGVWFDQELVGAHEWWSDIMAAIYHADLFIFALSPSSLNSEACTLERSHARNLNKRVLPILIAGEVNAALLPTDLQRIQFVDYRSQDKQAYQRLLETLTRLPAPLPLPHPLPPPPEAPISPLARINTLLDAPTIELNTQLKIVYDLKQYLTDAREASAAHQLLQRLKNHPDVRAQVAQDIAHTLGSAPPPQKASPSSHPNFTSPPVAHDVAVKPKTSSGNPVQTAIAVGAGIGFVLALCVGVQSLTQVGYDPSGGYFYYNDFSTLCASILIFPLMGAGLGWLFTKFTGHA